MLPVGVIGAGEEWEATWRPALKSQSRLQVAALYDPIAVRGESAARDVDARLFAGIRELLAAGPFRALLVLDAGWLGTWVLEEAARLRIPAFVAPAGVPALDLASLDAEEFGDLLVQPDLRRRYTPATMRLRELTATRLGAIEYISVEATQSAGDEIWIAAELIDWCRFAVQSAVVSAKLDWKEGASGPSRVIQLTFRKQSGGRPLAAEVRLPGAGGESTIAPTMDFRAEAACGAGTFSISGIREIHWRTADGNGTEPLPDDRSSSHVQLDLFGRRLVGGLVPAPTLDDVRTAVQLARGALAEAPGTSSPA